MGKNVIRYLWYLVVELLLRHARQPGRLIATRQLFQTPFQTEIALNHRCVITLLVLNKTGQ